MNSQEIVAAAWKLTNTAWAAISPAMEAIAGFVAAWVLFVLQERRKERIAARATRLALPLAF
jgi:hypothetical protein